MPLYLRILPGGQGGPQPSRAQKRRDAKAAQEAEREARIAEEQAAMGDSARVIEERSLAELLSPLGLAVHGIPVSLDSWWAALCDGVPVSLNGGSHSPAKWVHLHLVELPVACILCSCCCCSQRSLLSE